MIRIPLNIYIDTACCYIVKGQIFDSVNPFHYSSTIILQVSRYLVWHKVSEVQVLVTCYKHIKKKKIEKKFKILIASCKKIFKTIMTQSAVVLWWDLLLWNTSERMMYGYLNILDIFLQLLILTSGGKEPSVYLKPRDWTAERQCWLHLSYVPGLWTMQGQSR